MSSPAVPIALQFLLFLFAGWASRLQQAVIAYLLEENRVLREQRGGRRLRLSDTQRRRLAVKGKAVGRKALSELAGIVTLTPSGAGTDDSTRRSMTAPQGVVWVGHE